MNNKMNNCQVSFALRVKMAREQQDRNLLKTIAGGVAFVAIIGAIIYFAPESIHGSLAFQEAVVDSYR